MKCSITEITRADIPELKDFAPVDWNFDYGRFLSENLSDKNHNFIVARDQNRIVGTGNLIVFGRSAWIGNMIVSPDSKRMGIGTSLFRSIISHCEKLNIQSINLIATSEGYPLYLKEGFKDFGRYNFYKISECKANSDFTIEYLSDSYRNKLWELDFYAMGEDRRSFLEKYTGNVYGIIQAGELLGAYYPDYGDGQIIAINERAGESLLEFKISKSPGRIVVPEQNVPANNYIRKMGGEIIKTMQRMVKLKESDWKPECVYNRGTGYAG